MIQITIQKLLKLIGFKDFSVNLDKENKKLIIFINEGEWLREWLPRLIGDITHIAKIMARKNGMGNVFVDINNYRKERENIITELAKAAARKAVMTKETVCLPAMNAYERRLIHMELAARPDIATESEGGGSDRRVMVRPLE